MDSMPPDAKFSFHIETTSKNVDIPVFVNVFASKEIPYPPTDFDEAELCAEVLRSGPEIPNFRMHYLDYAIHWSDGSQTPNPRSYVANFVINDKWAEKILPSNLLLHSSVAVILLALERIYNNEEPGRKCQQRLGHRMDLDFLNYKIDKMKCVRASKVLVDTKVIEECSSSTKKDGANEDRIYDLHYRPKSKVLTCSIQCDRMPDSIGFNEDRLMVRLGEKNLVDVYLPFFIDIDEPAKYKYDERLNLFRAVFKIRETL